MDETEDSYKRRLEDLKKYHILYQTPSEASGSDAAAQKEPSGSLTANSFEDVAPGSSTNVVPETKNLAPESQKNLAQTLPEVPLQMIFEYLKLKDLTQAQYVCRHWQNVARNENLWKHITYKVKAYHDEYELHKWQLVNAPMLQNIAIAYAGIQPKRANKREMFDTNEIVETVLCHQKHLRKLYIYSIEPDLMPRLTAKFPHMEDIQIGISASDVVSALDALKCCDNLKKFKFKISGNFPSVTTCSLQVTELLGNFFPSLKSFNLSSFQKLLSLENIRYILEKKLNQLESLELNYSKDADYEILNFISQRPSLKLYLNVWKELNLCILRPFQSVSLYVQIPKTGCLLKNMLQSEVCLLNVEHLSIYELFYRDDSFPCHRLKDMFPNVKSLSFNCSYHGKFDRLTCLADFPCLREICVSNDGHCPPDVIMLISKCSTLETLTLTSLRLTPSHVSSISQCSGLQHLVFKSCYLIDIQYVLSLLDSLHSLKTLSLFNCNLEVYVLNSASLAIIESACEIRHVTFLC